MSSALRRSISLRLAAVFIAGRRQRPDEAKTLLRAMEDAHDARPGVLGAFRAVDPGGKSWRQLSPRPPGEGQGVRAKARPFREWTVA